MYAIDMDSQYQALARPSASVQMYASSSAQLSVKSLCDRANVFTIGPAKHIAHTQHSPLAPVSAVACYPPPSHTSTYLSHAIVASLTQARWRARADRSDARMQAMVKWRIASAARAKRSLVRSPHQCNARAACMPCCRARGSAQLGTHAVRCTLTTREHIHEHTPLRALHPPRGAEQLDFNPTRFTYRWLRLIPHRDDTNATCAQASPNVVYAPSLRRVDRNIELDIGINSQVVTIAAKVACELAFD